MTRKQALSYGATTEVIWLTFLYVVCKRVGTKRLGDTFGFLFR